MLAADDERDFDYSAVTMAWIEDGFVPDHFSLGVENGRATQPWAWLPATTRGDNSTLTNQSVNR